MGKTLNRSCHRFHKTRQTRHIDSPCKDMWPNRALMKRIEEAKRLAKQAGRLASQAKKTVGEAEK